MRPKDPLCCLCSSIEANSLSDGQSQATLLSNEKK
jgi:hypothetical protein